ncbi:MAG TPA: choice-of-anchor tandem repeat GloVer-containing protein [Terriglobales bacterium]|nr:choice-of-anchor tandem repeat GloVer-containing protein [Terriglobales bacterium]
MTRSNAQHGSLIPEIRRRAVSNSLLLTILLVLPLIAIPSARAQTFTVVHKFTGGQDGAEPPAPVFRDTTGIYGVTEYGGSFNYGTVFRMDAAGKETVLHSFLGGEGLWPVGGLIRDAAGNLYGTTLDGGTPEGGACAHGCGTVFQRDKTGKQTVLYAFTGGTDGGQPNAALIRDAAGNLYGTTQFGGDTSCYVGLGCGVVFKLDKAGNETVLYRFTDGTDGKIPEGVVRDAAGNLYGTTYDGGTFFHGAVFKLDKNGKLTVLYSFTGGADSGDPKGPLIRDRSGNLYATTYGVGSQGYGVVFKLDTGGKLTVLYSFTGGSDGEYPSSLVLDSSGNLYGTALGGGDGTGCYYGGCGTVFKVDSEGKQTVLHSFKGNDGELPIGLIMDGAGNLYGTTLGGGKGSKCSYYHGCGTVFKLTP